MISVKSKSSTAVPISHYLDVTAAPFFADSSGQKDSTKAIVAAMDSILKQTIDAVRTTLERLDTLDDGSLLLEDSCENRRIDGRSICIFPQERPLVPTLYFPPGEYLVSDTLVYTLDNLQNSLGSEMSWQIRFRGAGSESTVLRLCDKAPGFAGPLPKPVVQFMRAKKTNVAMSNYFEDMSISTGRGNPSAIGLDFFANNTGAVRNVRIYSEDKQGFAALSLGHSNYSGILLKNISTLGFDYGCHFDSFSQTMFFSAEKIKIRHPQKVGIYVGGLSASLRNIDCIAEVPALQCGHPAGLTVLVDSKLKGFDQGGAFSFDEGTLYADNVEVQGYEGFFCKNHSEGGLLETFSDQKEQLLQELTLPRRCDRWEVSPVPRLPVLDTPSYSPNPEARSVGVREFGAVGDGLHDDTTAIQNALNSGAEEISFELGRYRLSRPVIIPASVERVGFNFCDLIADKSLANLKNQGAFRIEGNSSRPLFIEDLFAWEAWRGDHVMFDHASKRTLVLSDLHTQTLCFYRNSVQGGQVFIENVASTAGVIPGVGGHGRICFHFTGQKVWARQINPERGDPMILNDGGDLWMLGFKSEDQGVAVETINGGRSEILGGVLNGGEEKAVAFLSRDSGVRISTISNGWKPECYFGTIVKECRNGVETNTANKDCLSRGLEASRGAQICMSLYSSPRLSRISEKSNTEKLATIEV
ncbi:MAG: hypothetical protein ACK5LK_10395 [Chthoniobacterales bacterium]